MYKIAILGSENSHSWGFASLIAKKQYPEIELCGIYGDEQGNNAILTQSGYDCFMKDYNDLVGKVDAVMVTARHGANHLKYAKDYILSGVPVWIDKPITADPKEARELVKLCTENSVPVCGGSMLGLVQDTLDMHAEFAKCKNIRGGAVSAPVNMVNPYGNFWFYSSHLVQIMLSVFGYDVKSVSALRSENGVSAVYRYSGFDVTAVYGADYSVSVYSESNAVFRKISLDGGIEREMDEFLEMLHTGVQRQTFEEFTKPVFVIDATKKSFENAGKLTEIESL